MAAKRGHLHDHHFFNWALVVTVRTWYFLWREDGSVVYNCCRPRQRSQSQVQVPRDAWPNFTVSETLPILRARPIYLYSAGRGLPNYTSRHWVPFSLLSATRRATVQVFDPVSTWALTRQNCTAGQSQSQSQIYFTTGGLQPISSFWRQAPWDSRAEIFVSIEPLR
jgi:hypothetical protein